MTRVIGDGPQPGPLVLTGRAGAVLAGAGNAVLTATERRRGSALRHPADRTAHAAAHVLVRHCAAALTGRPVGTLTLEQHCAECGSTGHGKPSVAGLPDVHVSLAHTRGAVAAAADWHPVGVDVEARPVRAVDPALMTATLTAAEIDRVRAAQDPAIAYLRHWVRKECLVKIGAATLDDLSRVETDPGTGHDGGAGSATGRFGSLVVVDWFDDDLDAAVGAAASGTPTSAAFPYAGPVPATRPSVG